MNYLGITNLNQTVTASIPPQDTHPTQHRLLPTTDDKMARTRQTISSRRSLRLQNQNPPRQPMPIRSRYEQRSRMLQYLENLLQYFNILTWLVYETKELMKSRTMEQQSTESHVMLLKCPGHYLLL